MRQSRFGRLSGTETWASCNWNVKLNGNWARASSLWNGNEDTQQG